MCINSLRVKVTFVTNPFCFCSAFYGQFNGKKKLLWNQHKWRESIDFLEKSLFSADSWTQCLNDSTQSTSRPDCAIHSSICSSNHPSILLSIHSFIHSYFSVFSAALVVAVNGCPSWMTQSSSTPYQASGWNLQSLITPLRICLLPVKMCRFSRYAHD